LVFSIFPLKGGVEPMALEFLEYEDRPFVFDKESWTLFSMGGSDRSKWAEVENSDSAHRIFMNSCDISESEAKKLADDLAREREEMGRAKGKFVHTEFIHYFH